MIPSIFRATAAVCVTLLFVAKTSLAAELVGASTPAAQTNGCGTGWSRWFVPNSIPLAKCDFVKACDAHDICYGKCEGLAHEVGAPECQYLRCKSDGDLKETLLCKTDAKMRLTITAADIRKRKCDDRLYDDIVEQNAKRSVCGAFASIYRNAVVKWGDDAFQGIDASGKVIKQRQVDYDAALGALFATGTEEEILRTSRDVESGHLKMSDPIFYRKGVGLSNER